jgi:GntR family transcriptional repressor for pyruvate dehydrogenase complex
VKIEKPTMPFVPIRSESVAEVVSSQIRDLISEDVLRPGDRLPSERELCDRMQVSRTSLREGLKTLVSEKLLETRRGSGLFVSPHIAAEIASPLRSLIEAKPRAMEDFISFRRMLEGEFAAEAARQATQAERDTILRLLGKLEAAAESDDQAAEAQLDTEFHMSIIEAAHNVVAIQVVRSLHELLRKGIGLSRAQLYDDPTARGKLLEQHRAIARAICEERDDEARKAMHLHLDFVLNTMKKKGKEAEIHALADRRSLWEAEASSHGPSSG